LIPGGSLILISLANTLVVKELNKLWLVVGKALMSEITKLTNTKVEDIGTLEADAYKLSIEEKRDKLAHEWFKDVRDFTSCSPISCDDLLKRPIPEQQWLVKDLIPMNALTIIFGLPGSYKTRLMLHTAISVASGEPLFGQIKTTQSPVYIIDEENGDCLMPKMLNELGVKSGLPLFVSSRNNFTLNDKNVEQILFDCRLKGIKVVMFDSLVDMHYANENDAVEMGKVMKHFQRLLVNGLTVIVLHHARKQSKDSVGGGNEMRGSINIYAQADSILNLKASNGQATLKQLKLRYAIPHKPIHLLINKEGSNMNFKCLNIELDDEDLDAMLETYIIATLEEHSELNQQELIFKVKNKALCGNEHNIRTLLKAMEIDGKVKTKPGTGKTIIYYLPQPLMVESKTE